jgi:DNA-binding transcriptional ArsR family regulator
MSAGDRPRVDTARLVEELRLIGHPMRLELLGILARGERGVGELVADTGQSPALVSQQLALLRKAGLVLTRREAKQVFYSLASHRLGRVMASLHDIIGPAEVLEPESRVPESKLEACGISAAMFAKVEPRV